MEGLVHRFRSSRLRAELRRVYHPPKETHNCKSMIPLIVDLVLLRERALSPREMKQHP